MLARFCSILATETVINNAFLTNSSQKTKYVKYAVYDMLTQQQ